MPEHCQVQVLEEGACRQVTEFLLSQPRETVEIACGLDALAQGIRVALEVSQVMESTLFSTNAENAVNFLKASRARSSASRGDR